MAEKVKAKVKARTGKIMNSLVVIAIVLSVLAASVVPVSTDDPDPPPSTTLDSLVLSAYPDEMPADGVSSSTLTAVAYNANGAPVANAPVWFEIVSGDGTITDNFGDPNDGFVRGDPATATLTAGTTQGTVTIYAYASGPNYPGDYTTVTLTEAGANGSVAGTITYACNGTVTVGATVNLITQGGAEVDSMTTGANGEYGFTDVTPGGYYVNASKTRFWDNSTADVMVSGGATATANMMLWLKGDLDNDGISASEDDLVLMFKAYLKFIEPNWRYDLNEDGELADEDDLVLMFKAYLGFITLE